jgi:hypothetical protein
MTTRAQPETETEPGWRRAIAELPAIPKGRWAVGGSSALALHGLPVNPRDVDLVADHAAAEELVDALGETIISDEAPWDRGDVRAGRRALAVLHGIEVEILVEVEAVDPDGNAVTASPNLDRVERNADVGCHVPVLSLTAMLVVLEATGSIERARMVRDALDPLCHRSPRPPAQSEPDCRRTVGPPSGSAS